ncbi:MAG TPA: zf-HC2 domain-containing protein [Terracidiphilus sp.]|jgi:anti-sigma factor RsiW
MSGCNEVQAKFTEYLDDRLNGREMQRIAAHLEDCRECAGEWVSLCQMQASLSALGPVSEPEDLLLRVRVAVSQEQARSRRSFWQGWNLAWRNTVGPFLLQAGAGFASAVLLLGSIIVLVTMFTQPEMAQATKDEPLGNPTAPRLVSLSSVAGNNQIGALSGPVVVEVKINGAGRAYDYRIVSGPTDEATRAQIENMLVSSWFEPARFFGQPVRGLAVLSFSGVSVRG